jgi:DNA-binding beta-propeller fold protein YncE
VAVAVPAALALAVGLTLALDGGGEPTGRAAKAKPAPTAAAATPPRLATHLSLRSVPVTHQANAIAAAGGRLWLASFGTSEMQIVDPDKVRPVASTAPLGPGVVDASGRGDVVWIAQGPTQTITPIDARTAALVHPSVHLAHAPVSVAADPQGAWVGLRGATPGSGLLVRVDRAAGQITRTFDVRGGVERVETFDGAVWVATRASHRLLRLNTNTGAVERSYRVAAGGVGDLEAGGGYLWASLSGQGRVARIDPVSRRMKVTGVGRLPWGLAYNGGTLYVANRGSSTVSRLDARTMRRVAAPTRVPKDPFVMATLGRDVWVSCLSGRRVVRMRAT